MSDLVTFINPYGHSIILTGPNGERITFTKNEKKPLSVYFRRYVPRYLREDSRSKTSPPKIARLITPSVRQTTTPSMPRTPKIHHPPKQVIHVPSRKQIPGRPGPASEEATRQLHSLIQQERFPISNDIGIGILSYNRLPSLIRLIDSIRKFTNLLKVSVFISDESSDAAVKNYLSSVQDMTVILNPVRIGIAGNTNRLIRCLSRFKYKIMLNDDVEILKNGWESFYVNAMVATGFHHFTCYQMGVYGAKADNVSLTKVNNIQLLNIKNKPQGAILVFDQKAFKAVGYFDEQFGIYGMEHVDWSNRVSYSNIQPAGFFDVDGSTNFMRIYNEPSVTEDRVHHYNQSIGIFDKVKENKNRVYVDPTDRSKVPSITYVIPFRGQDRINCVRTVIQNIKAHQYPQIDIIVVEQNHRSEVNISEFDSVNYILATTPESQAFTKSMAVNLGVSLSPNEKVIIHDADMIVQSNYAQIMSDLLDKHDGVHIGSSVSYLSKESTNLVNVSGALTDGCHTERSVCYYEGGSLGCKVQTFMRIGGFYEEFIGYGNEDTDFFARLATTNFYNVRSINLVHLWHDRTPGWQSHHDRNKGIEKRLQEIPMDARIGRIRQALNEKYKFKIGG